MRKISLGLLLLTAVMNVGAAQTYQTATVISLLTDASEFGGCMARLSKNLANHGVDCTSWVTFDCQAESSAITKSAANTLYQTAQLAFITGRVVKVLAVDSVKVDGQCLATRIKFE